MSKQSSPHCEECGEELFELDREWHCPSCDSFSGFEQVPDDETFAL